MKRILLAGSIFWIGSSATAANLQGAVDDVCDCFKEPYKLVEQSIEKLQKAQASGDYSTLAQAQGEMMEVMSGASKCFESLPEKHPEIDANKELQNKVMAMAEEQCPNPAAQFRPGN